MTEKQDTKDRLTQIPIFAEMPEEAIAEILDASEERVTPARSMVFRQEDPGDSCYIIASGKVRVFKNSKDGMEIELTRLGAGESFGEMALLTGHPRSASVETIEDTHLTVIPKELFDRILKKYPDASYIFAKKMSDWVLRADSEVEMKAREKIEAPSFSLFNFFSYYRYQYCVCFGF